MAFSSSSSGARGNAGGPQVFINFRGGDLRKDFVDNLEVAFKAAKINVFIDYHEQVGRSIQHLLVRIEESRVALAIFSENYTNSIPCLDELVKIKECMDKGTLIGVPIFYKVTPSVVGTLSGDFGDKFRKLKRENRHDLVKSQKWEEALTSFTEIIGVHVPEQSGQSDRHFIELIVDKVKSCLKSIQSEGSTDSSMIYARRIEITHSENPKNWTWSSIHEPPNGAEIEIATMNEVYWMNITGNFHTKKLIPETKYEVVFVVKLEDNAVGWHAPVKLNLKQIMRDQSETVQEHIFYLDTYIGEDEWVDIKAGDFVAPPKDAPVRISFTMYQRDDAIRKTGLVVKGAAIREVD